MRLAAMMRLVREKVQQHIIGALDLDMNNEILAAVTIVHDGQVRHQPTAQALAAQGN